MHIGITIVAKAVANLPTPINRQPNPPLPLQDRRCNAAFRGFGCPSLALRGNGDDPVNRQTLATARV